jgi:hypothetical protein
MGEIIMRTIKVSIQDENTLVLQENAEKGDLIDLKSIHETDIDKATIVSVVNSIKDDAYNAELQKATEGVRRESALEQQIKEKEIAGRTKDDLVKKDSEIAELKAHIRAGDTSKELAITKAVSVVEKERDELKVILANQ